MYLADIFTIACNLADTCGMSLPCGFADVDGKKLCLSGLLTKQGERSGKEVERVAPRALLQWRAP